MSSSLRPSADQSTHPIGLSWQYALLLPPWLLPTSSPASSNGTPCANITLASRLRRSCRLSWRMAGSLVGPSTPQFLVWFLFDPSRLFSPVGSLCLRSYLHR